MEEAGGELVSATPEWILDARTGDRRRFDLLNAADHDRQELKRLNQAAFNWLRALHNNKRHVGSAGGEIIDPPVGEPCLFVLQHEKTDVAVFYTQLADDMGEAEVEDAVQSFMARVGGKLTEVIETRIWRYFPHITSREMGGVVRSSGVHAR